MDRPVPEVGEVWEVVLPSRTHYERTKQLRLIRKTEQTYSFSEPDTDPYCPVLYHIVIDKCKLLYKIPENPNTKINGVPDEYYERKITTKNPMPNVFNWSIDKNKYLSGNTSPN